MKFCFKPVRDSFNSYPIEMTVERIDDGNIKFFLPQDENFKERVITISDEDWEKLKKAV